MVVDLARLRPPNVSNREPPVIDIFDPAAIEAGHIFSCERINVVRPYNLGKFIGDRSVNEVRDGIDRHAGIGGFFTAAPTAAFSALLGGSGERESKAGEKSQGSSRTENCGPLQM